jgi:uncharacterized protein (DUF849 family)
MNKVIITAAITGSIHVPTMSEYLPIKPERIAEEAIRSYNEGAAVTHIHVRNPETGQASSDQKLWREVCERIKSKCDIIICCTTGGGIGHNTAERVAAVNNLKPELASFTPGSVNFGLFPLAEKIKNFKFDWEKPFLEGTENFVFANTFKTMREFASAFDSAGTKPELEVFDVGMINNIDFMIKRGQLKSPVYMQFVLGILGGLPATAESLFAVHNAARLALGEFNWSVCAAGHNQMGLMATAMTMGGNARVGMEDALYLEKGKFATSNAEFVAKVVRIAREIGREIATPQEARKILGLKGLNNVGF